MIYSKQNLQNLILDFKKQKRNTFLITLGLVLLIALCVTLVFVLKHISFAIIGFIVSIICFSYFFLLMLNIFLSNSLIDNKLLYLLLYKINKSLLFFISSKVNLVSPNCVVSSKKL